jgi:glycosyltransferase involved in cell wall biosynthesis
MSTKSRPRILFVIGTMGGGGAERQVIEILKRLDRSRFEPFLYLAMKQGELLDEVPADVPIFAFWNGTPESIGRKFLRLIKLTRLVRYVHLARVLHQHRINVVYDRTYLATLDAAGGCFLRPTPRISCCVVDPQPELELHARRSKRLAWWFARRAYRTAKIVLANSEGLRKSVINYFQLSPEHVQVFYNLLPGNGDGETRPDELTPTLDDQSTRIASENPVLAEPSTGSSSNAPFLIVTAGRLHPQKGQRFLLEAMHELVHQQGRSIKLIVFGKGESEAELRAFIRDHELENHVTLAGFVSDPRPTYRQANLFVLPSLYEGMPNALIEAVAMGIPVLSTDCPSGPREILDGGHCGRLVPTGDSHALAAAIADAQDHPEEWQDRAVVAEKRVKELFDPVIGIRRLETLLEQIAGRVSGDW